MENELEQIRQAAHEEARLQSVPAVERVYTITTEFNALPNHSEEFEQDLRSIMEDINGITGELAEIEQSRVSLEADQVLQAKPDVLKQVQEIIDSKKTNAQERLALKRTEKERIEKTQAEETAVRKAKADDIRKLMESNPYVTEKIQIEAHIENRARDEQKFKSKEGIVEKEIDIFEADVRKNEVLKAEYDNATENIQALKEELETLANRKETLKTKVDHLHEQEKTLHELPRKFNFLKLKLSDTPKDPVIYNQILGFINQSHEAIEPLSEEISEIERKTQSRIRSVKEVMGVMSFENFEAIKDLSMSNEHKKIVKLLDNLLRYIKINRIPLIQKKIKQDKIILQAIHEFANYTRKGKGLNLSDDEFQKELTSLIKVYYQSFDF